MSPKLRRIPEQSSNRIALSIAAGLRSYYPPAIVVRKTQATATKLTPQESILFDQVRDRLALATVEPAREHAEHDLQCGGVDHEAQLNSWPEERRSACGTVRGLLVGTSSV